MKGCNSNFDKKLSYVGVTTQCAVLVEMLSIAAVIFVYMDVICTYLSLADEVNV